MGRCARIQSYMSNGDWLNTSCDLLIGYWGGCMWCNDIDWLTRGEIDSRARDQCMIRACTLRGSEVGVDLWGIDIIHAIGGQIYMRDISNSSQSQLHSFNLLQTFKFFQRTFDKDSEPLSRQFKYKLYSIIHETNILLVYSRNHCLTVYEEMLWIQSYLIRFCWGHKRESESLINQNKQPEFPFDVQTKK